MKRQRLPTRRPAYTFPVSYMEAGQGREFTVTIGTADSGVVAEVFVDGLKTGTALRHIASDAAVLASIALQHGASLADLDHSLSRDEHGAPASIIAAVVAAMVADQQGVQ